MIPRVIAYYLPQFHPIPENDRWWGNGFTEWTNVAKARPLFNGHYQPRIPADLGFYDLRLPEVREAQAEMAKSAGIEGFCYWHYWFGNGRRLLERPFNEVLHSGKPDFGFCLAWANHTWSNKTWENSGAKPAILMEQCYGGREDNREHFYAVLPAFRDKRYIRVDGKPLFVVYAPLDIPRVSEFLEQWRALARENGLPGIHFVGCSEASSSIQLTPEGEKRLVLPKTTNAGEVYKMVLNLGFDAISSSGRNRAEMIDRGKYMRLIQIALRNKLGIGTCRVYQYKDIMKHFYVPEDAWDNVYPALLPQWDRSPRVGKANDLYVNSTPEYFKQSVLEAMQLLKGKKTEHRILMLRSWNEWAEGNYIEPDLRFGMGYIDALKGALNGGV